MKLKKNKLNEIIGLRYTEGRINFFNIKIFPGIANMFSSRKKIKPCESWFNMTRSTWRVQIQFRWLIKI